MSVFITGASSGIGESCATLFAKSGYDLVLIARRESRLASLTQKLREQYPIDVQFYPLDIRNYSDLEKLILQHPAAFEQIEVLINNAGLAKGLSHLQDGSIEDWEVMIDTNLKGLLYASRLILPKMLKNGKGHIINIGSVAGHWVYEKGNVYCATKFGVRALTEGLRLDVNGTGIRVTEISPGMVETEFSEVRFGGDREKAKSVYLNRTPLTPMDVAEAALWCVQRPAHVNISEITLFPTDQASVHGVKK